jgi:hypothetical protein
MSAHAKIAANVAKIEKLQAENAVLAVQASKEVNTDAIVKGDTVVAEYGRGENAREVTGIVKGIKDEPGKAKLFKLEIGEDFSAEVVTVFASAIRAVNPEAEQAADPLSAE